MSYLYYNSVEVLNVLSVRLPEELELRLNELSKLTKHSKSFFVKEALTHHLEDLEDFYISMKVLNDPKTKYYSTTEAEKYLDL